MTLQQGQSKLWLRGLFIILSLCVGNAALAQSNNASTALRLYVIDGGILESNPANYQLSDDEVQTSQLSIAAYLIEHPDGILLWDTVGIADAERIPNGTGVQQTIIRPDGAERTVTLAPSLTDQLAAIGYAADDITHLAFSHLHWDHTANANMFTEATWLVRHEERDLMFSDSPGGSARPVMYAELKNSETLLIKDNEHDVFGDGTVILQAAPGHSTGHQVLFVDLPNTGPVVLSGDLYHYPEERTLNRLPTFEMDQAQTQQSRLKVDAFLERTGAELWIGHDLFAHQAQRKAPAYYD